MRPVLLSLLAVLLAPAAFAGEETDAVEAARAAMSSASRGEVRLSRSKATGLASFVAAERGRPIAAPGATAEARARGFLGRYGRAFGLRDGGLATLRVRERDETGMDHVRLQQTHRGVPVTGAEITVHLRGDGVVAAGGRAVTDLDGLGVAPRVGSRQAAEQARKAVARAAAGAAVAVSVPRLEILNRGLLEGGRTSSRLAWYAEVSGSKLRERVWIDARTGQTLLRFSQLTDAKKRKIYDGLSAGRLPGTLIRSEGQPDLGDADADLAYRYLGDTYDYYFTNHGRDSYDGKGGGIRATVRHCPSPADCPFQNAFWNGAQMVFGEGFSAADDVDAHELTHAVTEHEADLFYYMQSGALNESFSDIFGETVDLGNGSGTDTLGVRWDLGEDIPVFGTIRNMMDPTLFDNPGKMSDTSLFVCEAPGADGGGVHSNSGVPNHAYALMVDGGSYNSVSVSGIGLVKAGKIQYRALTQYLSSASDLLEDANALVQSCEDLIGTSGISAGDCAEVENAIEAVEMENAWPCSPAQAEPAPLCDGGNVPLDAFFDDLEAGGARWRSAASVGPKIWFTNGEGLGPFGTSGKNQLWGYDYYSFGDATASMRKVVKIPSNGFLHFNHSFGFDNFLGTAYDGGVLEVSLDGGPYVDASGLIDAGAGYNATLDTGYGNPLGGRSAFGFASWGYTATRLDLSGLAGQMARFRFRIGSDDSYDDYGWFVDDVRIYNCVPPPPIRINDVLKPEGKPGGKVKTMVFTVTLDYASGLPVTVRYQTVDGSATVANADFIPINGTLTFAPGVTSATLAVNLIGDSTLEPDETFEIQLDSPVGGVLGDGTGTGTIQNDDVAL